ncbi:hypothetical protein RFI_32468, partial [Reticulomyxa filosa]
WSPSIFFRRQDRRKEKRRKKRKRKKKKKEKEKEDRNDNEEKERKDKPTKTSPSPYGHSKNELNKGSHRRMSLPSNLSSIASSGKASNSLKERDGREKSKDSEEKSQQLAASANVQVNETNANANTNPNSNASASNLKSEHSSQKPRSSGDEGTPSLHTREEERDELSPLPKDSFADLILTAAQKQTISDHSEK